MVIIQ